MAASTRRPLPAKATSTELMRIVIERMEQLHDCVHTVGAHVEKVDSKLEDVIRDLYDTREQVAYIKGVQADVSTKLGVKAPSADQGFPGSVDPDAKAIKPAFFVAASRWKVIGAIAGCATGIFAILQFLLLAGPGIAHALYDAIMAMA